MNEFPLHTLHTLYTHAHTYTPTTTHFVLYSGTYFGNVSMFGSVDVLGVVIMLETAREKSVPAANGGGMVVCGCCGMVVCGGGGYGDGGTVVGVVVVVVGNKTAGGGGGDWGM